MGNLENNEKKKVVFNENPWGNLENNNSEMNSSNKELNLS